MIGSLLFYHRGVQNVVSHTHRSRRLFRSERTELLCRYRRAAYDRIGPDGDSDSGIPNAGGKRSSSITSLPTGKGAHVVKPYLFSTRYDTARHTTDANHKSRSTLKKRKHIYPEHPSDKPLDKPRVFSSSVVVRLIEQIRLLYTAEPTPFATKEYGKGKLVYLYRISL